MKRLYFLIVILFATITLSAQNTEDTTDRRFHDTLLNHLVGKWNVSGLVHGQNFNLTMDVKWVTNHQYLRIYEKSVEVVPWMGIQYESEIFIGYNHTKKVYVVMEISVQGSEAPYKGFCYAEKINNQLKLNKKNAADGKPFGTQTFTWDSATNTWIIQARLIENGKEGEVMLEQKLVKAE